MLPSKGGENQQGRRQRQANPSALVSAMGVDSALWDNLGQCGRDIA